MVTMASYLIHSRNAAASILTGIVVTFVSVMGQSTEIGCPDGCKTPIMNNNVTFVITKNVSKGYDSSNCFPIATELLFLCNEQGNYQFPPSLTKEHLIRICTSKGWYDGFHHLQTSLPHIVKRERHCPWPPITQHSQNILIAEIQGRNINIDDNNMTSLFYSMGTTVTYKCKNSKPNTENHKVLRCTKFSKWLVLHNNYSSEWNKKTGMDLDLVCDSSKEVLIDVKENGVAEPQQIQPHISENPISSNENQNEFSFRPQPPPNSLSATVRNVLIGICSFLGFILFAVLFGVLHHNKVRLSKRYDDYRDHARPSSNSMPGDKSKLKKHFDDREQSLQYINIIPIKVNQETIYTEVETGKIAGKSAPTVKHKIEDDQVHSTVYAEIHHSTIPNDQLR